VNGVEKTAAVREDGFVEAHQTRRPRMSFSITKALARIKRDVAEVLSPDAIRAASRQAGHAWRERLLDPVTTVHLFLQQVLHGNAACAHVLHWAGKTFTAEAYCQARARLPLALFERLLVSTRDALLPPGDGSRTWLVDGTGFSMSDVAELREAFGQPGGQAEGCGFPVAHLLAAFCHRTGMILDAAIAPLRTHDLADVARLHACMKPGDVLVADRAFGSFAHLAILLAAGLHGVVRLHQRVLIDFRAKRPHGGKGRPKSRWLRRLGREDQLVVVSKPRQRPAWMTGEEYDALPDEITVRELRYRTGRPGFRTRVVTLVTTLLDADAHPAEDLAELYAGRWRAETNLRHLKQTMGMDVLRCRTVEGVLKEVMVYAIAYNLVCAAAAESAQRQGVEPNRISFIDALRWIAEGADPETLDRLLVLPLRPDRFEPRVRKRRPKQFPVMQKPRHELKEDLMNRWKEGLS
jgi:Transposase DDE domain